MKINPKEFRRAAGKFATGITSICTLDSDGQLIGLTANSFVSISLEPCLVMFSIQNSSTFMKQCVIGRRLGISVLSDQQKEVSDYFAGFLKVRPDFDIDNKHDCPIVKKSISWFAVEINRVIEAGDHHMILCKVVEYGINDTGNPLLYYSGYKNIGDSVDNI